MGQALASGWKIVFDFVYRVLALDGNRKSCTSFQAFYPHNLALAHQTDEAAQRRALHIHGYLNSGVRWERIGGPQKKAANADVPADRFDLLDRAAGGKAYANGELKIETPVSAFPRIGPLSALERTIRHCSTDTIALSFPSTRHDRAHGRLRRNSAQMLVGPLGSHFANSGCQKA